MSALQYKIFDKCVFAAILYAKVIGLWIYGIEHSRIKYSFLRVVYSISFYVFMLVGYLAVGREFVVSANKTLFVSNAFQSIFLLQTNIILISSVSLYTIQFLQYEKRKFAYEKCKDAVNLVKLHQLKVVDIRKYLVLFISKAVGIDLFTFTAIWFNWSLTQSGSDAYSPIYLVFTFLPISIVRFSTNIFYGGTLIVEAIFRQFNQILNDVFLQAKFYQLNNVGRGKVNSVLTYSRLSEEIDRLSVLHSKLIQATEAFNSVFSFQNVLSIILTLLTLVLRCFYEYIAVVEVITKENTGGLYRCIVMGITVSIASYDLHSTCSACESLVNQVRMTCPQKSFLTIWKELPQRV